MSDEQGGAPIEKKPEHSEEDEVRSLEEVKSAEEEKKDQEAQDNKNKNEIGMAEIMREKGQKGKMEQSSPAQERKSVSPPVIINPVFYYKGREKYEWRTEVLDATACLQKLDRKRMGEIYEIPVPEEVGFELVGTTNIKGHIFYNVRVKDSKGEREISRRYTQYLLWRSKLMELWPCVIVAALPSKTLMGVAENDLVRSRGKFIIRFLRSLCKFQALFQSQEVQIFLNESTQITNWQIYFSQIDAPKYPQILQKYKKHFTDEYVFSQREEFMYRKDKMPQVLDQYELYFSAKKIDLMDYCTSIRRMAESKNNYFKAMNKLNTTLLPDYEDTLYRWIYGESLPQPSPSIMERLSLKDKGQEGEKEVVPQRFGLYSSEAYSSKLQDVSLLIHDFNYSTWKIYDPIKFELKEIDCVISAIEQTKSLQREMEYLQRTIAINKDQIESLNSNKTTLKTFFMEGSSDDKKTKLTNDNHILEEQMEKHTELYYIMMVLLQKQLGEYHKARAEFYKNSMNKAFSEELTLIKNVMDFHIYEEQLFAKERLQRVQTLKGEVEADKEEIKESD